MFKIFFFLSIFSLITKILLDKLNSRKPNTKNGFFCLYSYFPLLAFRATNHVKMPPKRNLCKSSQKSRYVRQKSLDVSTNSAKNIENESCPSTKKSKISTLEQTVAIVNTIISGEEQKFHIFQFNEFTKKWRERAEINLDFFEILCYLNPNDSTAWGVCRHIHDGL